MNRHAAHFRSPQLGKAAAHGAKAGATDRGARRAALVRRPCAAAILAGLIGCGLAADPALAADFSWSGASLSPNWSDATNWVGGVTPSGATDSLVFPALASGSCATSPTSATCYASGDDLAGGSAHAISIDDGAGYSISGNAIDLGSGGLTAAPSGNDPTPVNPTSILSLPLTLSAPQTWTITGGVADQQLVVASTVSGQTAPLTIHLNNHTALSLADAEVGRVSVTGDGTLGDGFLNLGFFDATGKLVPGALNAVDGDPVRLSNDAELFSDDGMVGPLTLTAAGVQVGQASRAGTLGVVGNLTLDAQSTLLAFLSRPGTTAGTDYSQLTATGTIDLGGRGGAGGAALVLSDGEVPGSTACEQLTPGDVETLVRAGGGLTGTPLVAIVNGAVIALTNGTTVTLPCPGSGGALPTATISYTANAVLATVQTPGVAGTPTATALSADPAAVVTNQLVELTATVTAGSPPSGTVEFDNVGAPISGCGAQPLTPNGNSYTAICQTAFPAAPAPSVSAFFDPAAGSPLAPSTSPPTALNVGRAPTTTGLALSLPSVGAGQLVTATATVTPAQAGSAQPTGAISFLGDGVPIPAAPGEEPCSAYLLTQALMSACHLEFSGGTGSVAHAITAAYGGDANFLGSISPPQTTTYVAPATSGGASGPATTSGVPAVAGGIGRAAFGRANVTAAMADLVVTCTGTKGQRCTVRLELTTRERTIGARILSASAARTKASTRTVVVGTRTVTLAAGLGETVHVSLNAAGQRALTHLHKLPVTLSAAQHLSHGTAKPSTRVVTFKPLAKT